MDNSIVQTGIAVDSSGKIYVADRGNQRVQIFNPDYTHAKTIGTGKSGTSNGQFNGPTGIAVDSSGKIYVSDQNKHRVQIFNPDYTHAKTIGTGKSGTSNGQFNGPTDIEVNSSGKIYVADTFNHRVQIFNGYISGLASTVSATPQPIHDPPTSLEATPGNTKVTLKWDTPSYGGRAITDYLIEYSADNFDKGSSTFPHDPTTNTTIDVTGLTNGMQYTFRVSAVSDYTYAKTIGIGVGTSNKQFNSPTGIAVDSSGKIYVADTFNHRVQIFNPDYTHAKTIGTGVFGSSNEQFSGPTGIAVDSSGKIYVADTGNHRVQIFNSDYTHAKTIGITGKSGSSNGQFSGPIGIAVDSSGKIYVADRDNHRVQIFNSDYTHAKTIGITGKSGSSNGQFSGPTGIEVNSSGKIYVADLGNHQVQIFNPDYTHAKTIGTGVGGSSNEQFDRPQGIAVNSSGKIYVADLGNHRVQIFNSDYTYAGTIGTGKSGSSNGQFDRPYDIEVDSSDKIYVADTFNHRVQIFNGYISGLASTVSATPQPIHDPPTSLEATPGNTKVTLKWDTPSDNGGRAITDYLIEYSSNDGASYSEFPHDPTTNTTIDVTGLTNGMQYTFRVSAVSDYTYAKTIGKFSFPLGIAVDSSGKIYVADKANHRVQIFNSDYTHAKTIGTGKSGTSNGYFDNPTGIEVDSSGKIYVADTGNHRVQIFNPDYTHAKTIGTGKSGTSNGQFNGPTGIAVDSSGKIYVADLGNHRVQIFNPDYTHAKTIGTGKSGTSNGQFNGPTGIAVDSSGKIYVSDQNNHRVQIFNPDYTHAKTIGTGVGGSSNEQFSHPRGIAVDSSGKIYVADTFNHRVQIFNPDYTHAKTIGTGKSGTSNEQFYFPTDIEVNSSGKIYVADRGNQRVQIFNGYISGLASTVSATPGPPDPPTSLGATPGNTKVTLKWDTPSYGGSTITDYLIEYSSNDGASYSEFPHDSTTNTTIDVTGLTNYMQYTFRVSAVNSVGTSIPSNTVSATPVGQSSAPSGLTAQAGNKVVQLKWVAPSYGGSTITDYYIEYSSNDGASYSEFPHDPTTNTTIDVTGLTNYTPYTFRVSAVTSVGTGIPSNTVSATPVGQSTAPTSLGATPGNTKVTLKWDTPSDNGGRAITDYLIEYSSNDGASYSEFPHDSTTNTTIDVTGLTNYTPYTFRVSAVTSVGTGIPSNTVSATPVGQSTAPTSLGATPGNTKVTLKWDTPSDNGGRAITDYLIEYSSNDGASYSEFPHDPTTNTTIDVTGLTNYTPYTFRVSAVTSVGTGIPSNTVSATPGQPSAPSGLTAQVGNKVVQLNWDTPYNGGHAITDYYIEYSADDGASYSEFPHDPTTNTTIDVTGLTNGKQYIFRVYAVTPAGTSIPSTVSATPGQPDPPSGLTAQVGNKVVQLNWDTPYNGGRAITDYYIEYSADDGASYSEFPHDSTTNTTIVTELTNGMQYTFRVSAVTPAGTSIPSTVSATPVGQPDPPSGLTAQVGNKVVQLNWDTPYNGGHAITDYYIEYSSNDGASYSEFPHDPTTNTTIDVTGLTNGMQYTFKSICSYLRRNKHSIQYSICNTSRTT